VISEKKITEIFGKESETSYVHGIVTTVIPLSLLVLWKLSFPAVSLKIPSLPTFALKSAKKKISCGTSGTHPIHILVPGTCTFRTIISQQRILCYFLPLRSKYSPQHPFLKQLQSVFFPYCKKPSSTRMQNNRWKYSSVLQIKVRYSVWFYLRPVTRASVRNKGSSGVDLTWSLWACVQDVWLLCH